MKRMLPYLLGMGLNFYLLPSFMVDTGSAMIVVLLLLPFFCFLLSLLFGRKHAFQPIFPILVMLLWLPSLFLFYNSSAWIYAPIYGAISLLGVFIGAKLGGANR